eukprot:985035-Pyramimonas_sp.AAC.1
MMKSQAFGTTLGHLCKKQVNRESNQKRSVNRVVSTTLCQQRSVNSVVSTAYCQQRNVTHVVSYA